MPKIQVVKDFVLTDETTKVKTVFKKGTHEVEPHVADHWFVKAHLAGATSNPATNSPAFMRHAAEERARREAQENKRIAERDAAISASVREKMEAEMAERIKVALEQQAASRVNAEDEIQRRVEEAKTAMKAELEAEMKARVDKAVEEALEGLIGDESKGTEKAPDPASAKASKAK